MGTTSESNIASALFGKTRLALLTLLYGNPEQKFYLRQIIRNLRFGPGAVQREVKNLSEAGIIKRSVSGRQVYYQADPECPIFDELKNLVIKTAGLADVLRAGLAHLEDRIETAFIFGSFAGGESRRASDVDLLVVGSVTFAEVVSALQPVQAALSREINPLVFPVSEFRAKLADGNSFLDKVLSGKLIFLIGNEHDFERLAGKRLA